MAKATTKKHKKETLVLLDAHAILHRAYHALPDFTAPDGKPTGALYGVVTMLLKIIEEFKPEYIIACYDLPEPTYRHNAYEAYKGTRTKTDDALVEQIKTSYDLLEAFGIKTMAVPGFEADDLLGTLAAKTKLEKDLQVVIASGDMDTLQCVDKKRVTVYTLKKGIKDTIIYDEKTVEERFGFLPSLVPDYKGLRGDASDNIPGIPGIGEKTATALITNFGSIEKMYKKLKKDEQAFLDVGIKPRIINLLKEHEEEAVFSKMLATIRVDAPVEFVMEEARWRECADTDKVSNLFSKLGFRSLTNRINHLFNAEAEIAENLFGDIEVSYDESLVAKGAMLLWLLESERTNASANDLIDYGRAYFDLETLEEILQRLESEVKELPAVYKLYKEVEEPLTPVLAKINQTGISLDTDYLSQLSKKMHKELDKLETAIYDQAGQTFNLNSPKQLGDILFINLGLKPKNQKKTAGGNLSTKESELEKIRDEHPIIVMILRYRALQKLTSTYIDALPKQVSADGRLRTTFLQTGTVTGRLASRDPNLQNIPVRTEESKDIRRAFVASPGYKLVSIDYSQIELRIAAILSQDFGLVDIFRRSEDVHTGVAIRVFGVDAENVTSEMRRKAKIINFGILYGMGVNALRQNLGDDTSREEAQNFLNAYFTTFNRLADYLKETKQFALEHGYTETMFGRRRHFPGIRSQIPFIKAQAERMAINAPIQGTQADIIRIAMNRIAEKITEAGWDEEVRMLLQVHDELVFEVRDEKVAEIVPVLADIMRDVLTPEQRLEVPILVDIAVGDNWRELEDWVESK